MYKQRIREDGTAGGNKTGSEDHQPPPALPGWRCRLSGTQQGEKILGDPAHPGRSLLDPLPSGRRCRVVRRTDLETPSTLGPPGCWVITEQIMKMMCGWGIQFTEHCLIYRSYTVCFYCTAFTSCSSASIFIAVFWTCGEGILSNFVVTWSAMTKKKKSVFLFLFLFLWLDWNEWIK